MSADGKVVIQTELDTKQADKQAKNLGKSLKSGISKGAKITAGALATVGTATVATAGAMVKATKATMDYGVEVNRNSQKLNMSKQAYQEWSYVLKRSGTSIDSLRMGMKKISTQIDEAKNGSASATENFKRLGLSVNDLKGKSQEEVFSVMVERLQGIKDTTERSAIANKFFGRSAQEMAGLLNKSGKEVKDLKKQAHDLGLVLSDDAIKKSAEFRGKLTELQSAFEGLRNRMAVKFLPALTEVTDGLSLLVQGKEADGLKQIEKGLKGFSDTLLKTVPTILKLGGSLVMSLSKAIINNLPQLISTGAQLVVNLIKGAIKMLPTALTMAFRALDTLVKEISKQLPALATTIMNSLISALQTIASNVPNLIQLATNLINSLLDAVIIVLQNLPNLVKVAMSIVNNLVLALIGAVPKFIERLPEIIGALITGILDSIGVIAESLVNLATSIIQKFADALKHPENVEKMIKGIIAMNLKITESVGRLVKVFVVKIPTAIAEFVKGLLNPENIQKMVKGLISFGKNVVSFVVENMPKVVEGLKTWLKEFPDKVAKWLEKLPEKMMYLGIKAVQMLLVGMVYQMQITATFAKKFWSWLSNGGLKELPSKMFYLGTQVLGGLIKGIQSAWNTRIKWVASFAKGVVSAFTKAFNIGSPSKLMRDEVGKWVGIGLADGIVEGYEKANPFKQLNADIMTSAGQLQSAINTSLDLNNNIQGLAGAVVEGIANSNLTVKIGEREMGRVVRSY